MKARWAIIADDFTGALDAAAPFAEQGARVAFLIRPESSHRRVDAEVVAVSSNSRDVPEGEAVARTRQAVAQIDAEFIYKKLDSALRGHPHAELAVVEEALGSPRVLIAPAFPAQGRVTVDACQHIRDLTTSRTRRFDLAPVFARSVHEPLRLVSLPEVRAGVPAVLAHLRQPGGRRILADAENDEDLLTLAQVAQAARLPLTCGSAGLSQAVARSFFGGRKAASHRLRIEGRALVVCGSNHPVALAQIAHLRSLGAPTITLDAGVDAGMAADLCGQGLARSDHPVVALAPPATPCPPGEILRRLSEVTRAVIRTLRIRTLVVIGGETAGAVCGQLETESIQVLGQVMPGVPWGVAQGGMFDERVIVTKSGSFANETVLAHLLGMRA
jgi:uncharacterized protein YgbK (DUF1537 family)